MPKKLKRRPGPKEDRLVLSGTMKSNVKQALTKKRPANGWPKHKKSEK